MLSKLDKSLLDIMLCNFSKTSKTSGYLFGAYTLTIETGSSVIAHFTNKNLPFLSDFTDIGLKSKVLLINLQHPLLLPLPWGKITGPCHFVI